jgi:hypothetical protein
LTVTQDRKQKKKRHDQSNHACKIMCFNQPGLTDLSLLFCWDYSVKVAVARIVLSYSNLAAVEKKEHSTGEFHSLPVVAAGGLSPTVQLHVALFVAVLPAPS